jgi:hypothetical protein
MNCDSHPILKIIYFIVKIPHNVKELLMKRNGSIYLSIHVSILVSAIEAGFRMLLQKKEGC